MYIIELFIKWLNKNKRGEGANPENVYKESFDKEPDEALTCRHNFMPVDSTGNCACLYKVRFCCKKEGTGISIKTTSFT